MLKALTKIDEKGRVFLPKEIRFGLKKSVYAIRINNEVKIVPKLSLGELRSIAFGVTTEGIRDEKERAL